MAQVAFSTISGTPGFVMFGWPAADLIAMIRNIFSQSHSATHVTYQSGNEIITLRGNFPSYDANNDPTSGTITSIEVTTAAHGNGIMSATITGLSIQVAAAYPRSLHRMRPACRP